MIEFPASTLFNRRIPKQKFYDNLSVTPQLKRVFVEQINLITWRNKIATSTVNIAEGETVKEIEVFLIELNQQSLDTKVLSLIDKAIPYHILFLLEFKTMMQAWIGYKEGQTNSDGFKLGAYYHTEWLPEKNLKLQINGLNMDAVYANLIRQIAGERLQVSADTDIKEAVNRYEQRQKLQKEINFLEKKIQSERQFNRQVELNGELKKLKIEMERLA